MLTIIHQVQDVDGAVDAVAQLCRDAGANDDTFGVGLALREALVNALQHGNQGDARKRVFVRCALHGLQLTLQVRDEGAGFDPSQVADPRLPDNRMKASGRGLLLMKTYMHQVTFTREVRGGCTVQLTKLLTVGAELLPKPRRDNL